MDTKILSNIIFEELYTFDDGLGNVIKNPPILVEKWLVRKIISCVIRNSYSVKKLLEINKNILLFTQNIKTLFLM